MNLIREIFDWVKTRPLWFQDAARRLYENPSGLTAEDCGEIYSLFKHENGLASECALIPRPLQDASIPSGDNARKVMLKSLHSLKHVNAIDPNQALLFAESGLTVVYGENGSGKSGYARVLKNACFSRDKSEIIETDVTKSEENGKIPEATFILIVDGKEQTVVWNANGESNCKELSAISVFDEKSARATLTKEQELAYLPYGMDILQNIAEKVVSDIKRRAVAEREAINLSEAEFAKLKGTGPVGQLFSDLNKARLEDIERLSSFTDDMMARGKELRTIIDTEDLSKVVEDAKLRSQRFRTFAEKLENVHGFLSPANVEYFCNERNIYLEALAVEREVAATLAKEDGLLAGTGGQFWKQMFIAARRYATQEAYPNTEYPSGIENARCVFCQQPLSPEAVERITTFNAYMSDVAAKNVALAKEKITKIKDQLKFYSLSGTDESTIIKEVTNADTSLGQELVLLIRALEDVRLRVLALLENSEEWNVLGIPASETIQRMRSLVANEFHSYRRLRDANDPERLKRLKQERDELAERYRLSQQMASVRSWFVRKELRTKFDSAIKKNLSTLPITQKMNELSERVMTEPLKQALNQELSNLGVSRYVRLTYKTRGSAGKIVGGFALDNGKTLPVPRILSEGEQKVLALASFFAETGVNGTNDALVFDDPVTSLDLKAMKKIVRRIVAESARRQIVVFTHNPLFFNMLMRRSEHDRVPVLAQHLTWSGVGAGKVNDGPPGEFGKWTDRLNNLKHRAKVLRGRWTPVPSADVIIETRSIYSELRAIIERVVQEVFLNGTVRRFEDYIQVENLKNVVGLDGTLVSGIVDKFHDICGLIDGHDRAPGSPDSFDIDQLDTDIKAVEDIANDVKKARARNP